MSRNLILLFALVSGCSSAPANFVRGPANEVQFVKDRTYCQGIGEKQRAAGKYADGYNDCMLTKGYRTGLPQSKRIDQ